MPNWLVVSKIFLSFSPDPSRQMDPIWFAHIFFRWVGWNHQLAKHQQLVPPTKKIHYRPGYSWITFRCGKSRPSSVQAGDGETFGGTAYVVNVVAPWFLGEGGNWGALRILFGNMGGTLGISRWWFQTFFNVYPCKNDPIWPNIFQVEKLSKTNNVSSISFPIPTQNVFIEKTFVYK